MKVKPINALEQITELFEKQIAHNDPDNLERLLKKGSSFSLKTCFFVFSMERMI